jgi:hypothetical protein
MFIEVNNINTMVLFIEETIEVYRIDLYMKALLKTSP